LFAKNVNQKNDNFPVATDILEAVHSQTFSVSNKKNKALGLGQSIAQYKFLCDV